MVQLYAYFRKPKLLTILLLQCIFVLCAVVNSYAQAPNITSFLPAEGRVGDEVTIRGQRFTGASSVWFGSGKSLEYTVVNDTEIRAKVPSNANSGGIAVFTPDGKGYIAGPFILAFAPSITSFSPVSGRVGDEVTIRGQGFTGASSVWFGNGKSLEYTVVNDTEIRAKVPLGASEGKISINTVEGVGYSKDIFTLPYAPSITSFSPVSGRVGDEVTIRGQRFTGASSVWFGNGKSLEYTVVNDTEIRAKVPSNANSGGIAVFTPDGKGYIAGFTVLAPIIILTPNTINFTDVPSGSNEIKQYQVSGEGLTNGTPVSINIGDATSPFTIATSENGEYSRSIPLSGVTNNRLSATTIWVKYAPLSPTPDGAPQTGSIVHTQGSTSGTLSLNATAVGPMPVELAYFTAKSKDGSVVLEWKTASEENNSHFEIEMATGTLSNFAKVATVASKASNSTSLTYYKHQQKLVNYGQTLYFRLKQVDLDGTFSYSKTVSVEPLVQQEGIQPLVAPNPVTSNSRLILTSNESVKATMYLSSLAGKRILTKAIIVLKGHNEIDLPMLSTLEKGMYILNIELDGRMHQVKVIKN